jgi:cytidine deaminase
MRLPSRHARNNPHFRHVPTMSAQPIHEQELIAAALAARERAYAPYSGFSVGAAVQFEDGRIAAGCNVENASYGLTICAERAAVLAAVGAGAGKLVAIAVVSQGGVTPCGACRQVLAEFANDLTVLLVDVDRPDQIRRLTLAELLPERFHAT